MVLSGLSVCFLSERRDCVNLLETTRERSKEITIEGEMKDCGKTRKNYSEKEEDWRDEMF